MSTGRDHQFSVLIRKQLLSTLDRVVSIVLKPFSQANTLGAYSTRGYIALGIFSAIPFLYLWGNGTLNYPLSRAPEPLRLLYRFIVDRLSLGFFPDSLMPIVALPFLVYIALGSWSGPRTWLGERFANLVFYIANQFINLGEWCIEHRWSSLGIIIVLVALLSVGLYERVEERNFERMMHNDFEDWVTHVDDFVDQNSVSHFEDERYRHVKTFWRNSFNSLEHLPGGYRHPAIYLEQMLGILYLKPEAPQPSWGDHLRNNLDKLESCMAECRRNSREAKNDDELRAWSLMNILMGRIHVRLAEGNDDPRELIPALSYFSAVNFDRYHDSATNGKGTVYAHAFSAYLEDPLPGVQRPSISEICPSAYQCAVEALRAYEEAAEGHQPCSFHAKRKTNNIVDLLSRIGMHYSEVVRHAKTWPLESWMATPTSLAEGIHLRINEMMACNDRGPFISSVFVTAAQGFGASAQLRKIDGRDSELDIASAGLYLRLANSFEGSNSSTWELQYFCPLLREDKTRKTLLDSINRSFDGLPSSAPLIQRLEQRCR